MKISSLRIDNLEHGAVTDQRPTIAFTLTSDEPGEALAHATVSSGEWSIETADQVGIIYGGAMEPFSTYTVTVNATGTSGATATAHASFTTGRLTTPWTGEWITDRSYRLGKTGSPTPMQFRTTFTPRSSVRRAWLEATALGIYELDLNGTKVGDAYFAPGLTSYRHHIQYQTHDITDQVQKSGNTIVATVAGGWAVGSFNYKRKNKISADRQAFLCDIHLEYTDGTLETIATDPSWAVSTDGPFTAAEWYDGEAYDATVDETTRTWKPASTTRPRGNPELLADYGAPVRAQQVMLPVAVTTSPSGETIYDFGQNFAGVIHARIKGHRGEVAILRHAEVLVDGELFTKSLRTAKATATYTCIDGEQEYSPRLTYMGFRYVGLTGISSDQVELTALVLHSDIPTTGTFTSSNELLNKLNENIRWGGRSNFVDIPTDCPQRDERQGWTGDLTVFASTASYNFDMSRFLDKWLRDVTAEQSRGGGIPMVVPRAGDSWPVMATSCWGDSCILVPWAEYLARGHLNLLRRQYTTMKRFLSAAQWWAGLFSIRPTRRLIWKYPFQFGDWAAPTGGARDWIALGKWIATPYLANSAGIVATIAELLGESEDAQKYRDLQQRVIAAYRKELTDGKGSVTNEFQTAYVLPLHFGMTTGAETEAMASNLVRLIGEAGGHLATGFPGTPYILFALSDNDRVDEAYDLLLQTDSPSWLYEVVAGGTTIWERWDALRPDGTVNTSDLSGKGDDDSSNGGMVSFNHYAAGAVGDWLYRRILGIEATTGGYREFTIKPVLGGGITSAEGSVLTPYGTVGSAWEREGERFAMTVTVPVSTTCTVTMPDATVRVLTSGTHELECGVARRTDRDRPKNGPRSL